MLKGWLRLCVLGTVLLWQHLSNASTIEHYDSGCRDGSTEGFQDDLHPKIAACAGEWQGHVSNSSNLCAPGWRVCAHYDKYLLKTITWKDATNITGCYAINAAQDGGLCRPCISDLEQDDLAGVGRGCPHQSFGQKSCISGGQIDVSCCVDTHFNKACMYRPGLATGVVCCKLPGVPPQILVHPQEFTHVTTGVTFVLSCQAMGTPTPTLVWYKNSQPLPKNVSRVSVFDSGYLLISEAQPSDSGEYWCHYSNIAGNASAVSKVLVTDHSSGCADGTTDGFHQYEDIQACKGRWNGHVKRGRYLCANGWHVCNTRDSNQLKMLTWNEIESTDGCYAYNAANSLNECTRCHRGDMAGVGNRCGRIRRNYKSCLAEGRVDVFKSRMTQGCSYLEGLTSGVVCCKKRKRTVEWHKRPKCRPKCMNGGKCVDTNRCKCASGYKGAWCQNAYCPGGCIANSYCSKPGICKCKPGYTGGKCRNRADICWEPCYNGGRCLKGKCQCSPVYWGNSCQFKHKWRPLSDLNRTER